MPPMTSPQGTLAELARNAGQWLLGWWRTVHLAALLTVLATLYPAWRAARLDPVEAIQSAH